MAVVVISLRNMALILGSGALGSVFDDERVPRPPCTGSERRVQPPFMPEDRPDLEPSAQYRCVTGEAASSLSETVSKVASTVGDTKSEAAERAMDAMKTGSTRQGETLPAGERRA